MAVGVDAFVEDVTGLISEGHAATSGLTVSYIPLSHSSDRYKVWQHLMYGGRVAFASFGAEQWEWREKDKETNPTASPVAALFQAVASVRPTSMSCPPNIWAGLHGMYRYQLRLHGGNNDVLSQRHALDTLVAVTMGVPSRMNVMATGGAPTPKTDYDFAKIFCRHIGAAICDSYGTTEAGALTMDGRQLSEKFGEVEMQLVDLTNPRHCNMSSANASDFVGEIVVQSPVCALGYMGDVQKTKEAFFTVSSSSGDDDDDDRDGGTGLSAGRWYRTGDVGRFDGTGRLHLLGRVSSLLHAGTTSFMPTVYETDMTSEWSECDVLHVVLFVLTSGETIFVVGVVHSDCIYTDEEKKNMVQMSLSVKKLRQKVGDGVKVTFHFTNEEWSVSNGLLTGSQKVSVGKVRAMYAKILSGD